MAGVAVLFARSDSVYKQIDGCDVYDVERDARTWAGGCPVIAHPPCRAWGRLRQFANPRPDEKELAHFAVHRVQQSGGVLVHPHASTLWDAAGLPAVGVVDVFGGWTLPVSQYWWGHRARKNTWLYIVGVAPCDVPIMPLVLGDPLFAIRSRRLPEVPKAEREHTPVAFALWLVDLAKRCQVQHG